MHLDENTGELIGKVEVPHDGWFTDFYMEKYLGKELKEILSYPKKHGTFGK